MAEARASFPVTFRALRRAHPDAHCELDHDGPFQLIVATVLSAQSTDVAVNQVTPELFRRFPGPQQLATAKREQVEKLLGKLGMFRQKAKNIIGLAHKLDTEHQGEVPDKLEQLVDLPGVGRKTANVVLGVAFGKPEGVVVDTHVQRISQRLGWTQETTPERIEADLMSLAPRRHWDVLSHTLIFHGRRICSARNPACTSCPVNRRCPSAFNAEHVGRKPPRFRSRSEQLTGAQPAKPGSAKPETETEPKPKAQARTKAKRKTTARRSKVLARESSSAELEAKQPQVSSPARGAQAASMARRAQTETVKAQALARKAQTRARKAQARAQKAQAEAQRIQPLEPETLPRPAKKAKPANRRRSTRHTAGRRR